MTKVATFAASVTLTGSDEPEQDQIDFGPYIGNQTIGNTNVYAGIASANTVSPSQSGVMQLAATPNNVSSVGPAVAPNVFPIYFGLLPLMETSGNLSVMGANTDTGVQVSSTFPTFIPVLANAPGEGSHAPAPNGVSQVYISASVATQIKTAWG